MFVFKAAVARVTRTVRPRRSAVASPAYPASVNRGRVVPSCEPPAGAARVTTSQSGATISAASARTVSRPAPQVIESTSPSTASIVSLP
jgi:hypothetical protein